MNTMYSVAAAQALVRRLLRTATLFPLGFLGACPGAVDSDPGITVTTDASRYEAVRTETTVQIEMEVSLTNPTGQVLYLAQCGSSGALLTLEKQTAEGWKTAIPNTCFANAAPPIEVKPGGTYKRRVRFTGHLSPNTSPEFRPAEVRGTYRVGAAVFTVWDDASNRYVPVSPEQSVSAPVEVVEAGS